jgi:imidazolonepropionase-like amidohydrolase
VKRLLACGACLVSGGCIPSHPITESRAGLTDVAFIGVNVLPMTSRDSTLVGRTVLVRDGRIAAIGPAATVKVPARAFRIDARGQYLMPGLVDAHVHLEYFGDPSVLALFLANGVTSVRNMDGRPYLLAWKGRTASGDLLGPTIYTAGPILDGDPPVRDDNTVVRNVAEARAAVAAQDSVGYDFVKVYTNLSAEVYRAVLAAARERGRRVAGHVPRSMSVEDVLASGQHSVEHLTDFDELVEAETSSVRNRSHWSRRYLAMPVDTVKMVAAARRVAASGVWIVPTVIQADRGLAPLDSVRAWLAAPEMARVPAEGREFWERLAARNAARMDSADWQVVKRGRANRRALLRALRMAGAKIAVGTDTPNPFVVPGFSVHEELAIFVEAGFSPREALMAATRQAAELMDTSDVAGTVEIGKRADLVLLSTNPLADIRTIRRPVGVMVRGRWIPAPELETLLKGPVLR